jgi:hypothetical protein
MTREEIIEFCEMKAELEAEKEFYKAIIKALEQEPDTWSLEDAREDFMDDVYNTLDFLPTNDEANQIIDSFDRVTSSIRREPCEDCISREEALKVLCDKCPVYDCIRGCSSYRHIEKMPSVTPKYTDEEIDRAQAVEEAYIDKMVELVAEEAKRPKGKWIYKMQVMNNPYTYKCSVCKEWVKDQSKYCPNCGARMTEREEV